MYQAICNLLVFNDKKSYFGLSGKKTFIPIDVGDVA
jgi:hypothetical protein